MLITDIFISSNPEFLLIANISEFEIISNLREYYLNIKS